MIAEVGKEGWATAARVQRAAQHGLRSPCSVGGNGLGVGLAAADALALLLAELDVAALAPAGAPRVLDEVVGMPFSVPKPTARTAWSVLVPQASLSRTPEL